MARLEPTVLSKVTCLHVAMVSLDLLTIVPARSELLLPNRRLRVEGLPEGADNLVLLLVEPRIFHDSEVIWGAALQLPTVSRDPLKALQFI